VSDDLLPVDQRMPLRDVAPASAKLRPSSTPVHRGVSPAMGQGTKKRTSQAQIRFVLEIVARLTAERFFPDEWEAACVVFLNSPAILISFERYEDRRAGREVHPHRILLRDYKQMALLAERLSRVTPEFSTLNWRKCYRIYEETIQCKYSPDFTPEDLAIMQKAIWDCLVTDACMAISYRKSVRDRLSCSYPMKKYTNTWNALTRNLQQRLIEERKSRREALKAASKRATKGNPLPQRTGGFVEATGSDRPDTPESQSADGQDQNSGSAEPGQGHDTDYNPFRAPPAAEPRRTRRRPNARSTSPNLRKSLSQQLDPEELVREEIKRMRDSGKELKLDPSSIAVQYWPLFKKLGSDSLGPATREEGEELDDAGDVPSDEEATSACGTQPPLVLDTRPPDDPGGTADGHLDEGMFFSIAPQTGVGETGNGLIEGSGQLHQGIVSASFSSGSFQLWGSSEFVPLQPADVLAAGDVDRGPMRWGSDSAEGSIFEQASAFQMQEAHPPPIPAQGELSRMSSLSLSFNSTAPSFDGGSQVEHALSGRTSLCDPGYDERTAEDGSGTFSSGDFTAFTLSGSGGSSSSSIRSGLAFPSMTSSSGGMRMQDTFPNMMASGMAKLPSMSSIPAPPSSVFPSGGEYARAGDRTETGDRSDIFGELVSPRTLWKPVPELGPPSLPPPGDGALAQDSWALGDLDPREQRPPLPDVPPFRQTSGAIPQPVVLGLGEEEGDPFRYSRIEPPGWPGHCPQGTTGPTRATPAAPPSRRPIRGPAPSRGSGIAPRASESDPLEGSGGNLSPSDDSSDLVRIWPGLQRASTEGRGLSVIYPGYIWRDRGLQGCGPGGAEHVQTPPGLGKGQATGVPTASGLSSQNAMLWAQNDPCGPTESQPWQGDGRGGVCTFGQDPGSFTGQIPTNCPQPAYTQLCAGFGLTDCNSGPGGESGAEGTPP